MWNRFDLRTVDEEKISWRNSSNHFSISSLPKVVITSRTKLKRKVAHTFYSQSFFFSRFFLEIPFFYLLKTSTSISKLILKNCPSMFAFQSFSSHFNKSDALFLKSWIKTIFKHFSTFSTYFKYYLPFFIVFIIFIFFLFLIIFFNFLLFDLFYYLSFFFTHFILYLFYLFISYYSSYFIIYHFFLILLLSRYFVTYLHCVV